MQGISQDELLHVCCFLDPFSLFTLRQANKLCLQQANRAIFLYPHLFDQLSSYMTVDIVLSLLKQQKLFTIYLSKFEHTNEKLLHVLLTQHPVTQLHVQLGRIQAQSVAQEFKQVPNEFFGKLTHLGLALSTTRFDDIYNSVLVHCKSLRKLYLHAILVDGDTPKVRSAQQASQEGSTQVEPFFAPNLEELDVNMGYEKELHGLKMFDLSQLCNTLKILKNNLVLTYLKENPNLVFKNMTDLECSADPAVWHLPQCMPNLQRLKLGTNSYVMNAVSQGNYKFLYELKALRHLEITAEINFEMNAPELFKQCKNIETLVLTRTGLDAFDLLDFVYPAMRRLTLKLHSYNLNAVKNWATYFPNLKHFSCTVGSFNGQLSDDLISSINPCALSFVTMHNSSLSTKVVDLLFTQHLMILELVECTLEYSSILSGPKSMPNLRKMTLSQNIPGEFLCSLKNMHQLYYLNICNCTYSSTDNDIAALLKQAPNLTEFYANDTMFGALSQAALPKSLIKLELSNAIQTESLKALPVLPNLHYLCIGTKGSLLQNQESELVRIFAATPNLRNFILDARLCKQWKPVLVQVATTCTTLQRMSISKSFSNGCDQLDMSVLAQVIQQCSKLQSISIDVPVVGYNEWKQSNPNVTKPRIMVPMAPVPKKQETTTCALQ